MKDESSQPELLWIVGLPLRGLNIRNEFCFEDIFGDCLLRQRILMRDSRSFRNHTCCKQSSAEGLSICLDANIFKSRSLHSGLTWLQVFPMMVVTSQCSLRVSISLSVLPPNNNLPVTKLKIILPSEKISDLSLNGSPLSTSGSTYPGDPHFHISARLLEFLQAKPKSAMHTLSSVLFRMRMLSGLMSLW